GDQRAEREGGRIDLERGGSRSAPAERHFGQVEARGINEGSRPDRVVGWGFDLESDRDRCLRGNGDAGDRSLEAVATARRYRDGRLIRTRGTTRGNEWAARAGLVDERQVDLDGIDLDRFVF